MRKTLLVLFLALPLARAEEQPTAVDRGLAWLGKHQADNGSWGKRHSYSVTALGCLAHLAASDAPFAGARAGPLLRGLRYLMAHQTDGVFPAQGHTWIHGQGFATLALSEAYGRLRGAKAESPLDLTRLERILKNAVAAIARHQSRSGGWWYHANDPNQHEGSTTVCAVQALVSASNHGIAVDRAVLDKGFAYLKRCQNPDGGFDYKEGPGTVSMKEGTAAGVATLALMRRFDYQVMVNGIRFLTDLGPDGISKERFPYYGHFYGCMGMKLYGEEMAAAEKLAPYVDKVHETLRAWQGKDGAWPLMGWMKTDSGEDGGYATAFAALVLSIPDARLSIFNRAQTSAG